MKLILSFNQLTFILLLQISFFNLQTQDKQKLQNALFQSAKQAISSLLESENQSCFIQMKVTSNPSLN